MIVIERTEPERPHKDDPPCTCGSTAVIDANRHDWRCARRLWIERNDSRGAVEERDRLTKLVKDISFYVEDDRRLGAAGLRRTILRLIDHRGGQ